MGFGFGKRAADAATVFDLKNRAEKAIKDATDEGADADNQEKHSRASQHGIAQKHHDGCAKRRGRRAEHGQSPAHANLAFFHAKRIKNVLISRTDA